MLKKSLATIALIYVVGTVCYFLYKYAPYIEKYFDRAHNKIIEQVDVQEQTQKVIKDCESFAFGHIAIDQFRIQTRFRNSASGSEKVFQENDLQKALATVSCDRSGQKALIYYDSKPVAIASIQSFDYSKPLADRSTLRPEFYSILQIEKKLANFPDNGYVIAVYEYDQSKLNFYNYIDDQITQDDEKLITSNCDTIYSEGTKQDPKKVEMEYSALKTLINPDGTKEISILATWTDHRALLNIHLKPSGSTARYILMPITRTNTAILALFQVADINNDGYKETIIKEAKEGNESFIIYYYDANSNVYKVAGDHAGE